MQIQINPGEIPATDAIDSHIRSEVEHALRHFREQVTRVEVHLHDLNGQKAGVDKRCLLEARLAGLQPMVAEHVAADMYEAIKIAAEKLERVVRHRLERHEEKRSQT
jgi:ribosomal subunit interface protein